MVSRCAKVRVLACWGAPVDMMSFVEGDPVAESVVQNTCAWICFTDAGLLFNMFCISVPPRSMILGSAKVEWTNWDSWNRGSVAHRSKLRSVVSVRKGIGSEPPVVANWLVLVMAYSYLSWNYKKSVSNMRWSWSRLTFLTRSSSPELEALPCFKLFGGMLVLVVK